MIPLGVWTGFKLDHVRWYRTEFGLIAADTTTLIGAVRATTYALMELHWWMKLRGQLLIWP